VGDASLLFGMEQNRTLAIAAGKPDEPSLTTNSTALGSSPRSIK
jgi:hypothetical protein